MTLRRARLVWRSLGPWLMVLLASACSTGVERALATLGARRVAGPLEDAAKLERGATEAWELAPSSLAEVQRIVRMAYAHDLQLRIRGRGHSQSGSSLPRRGELVLRTSRLDWHRFEGTDLVCGAALGLPTLRRLAAARGLAVPVYNGGGSGPSIGGFVAAGGMGPGSAKFGGLWESVEEVTLVDGKGEVRRVRPGDALFPWLFGSMGQLGVVVEVRLRLVAAEAMTGIPVEAPGDVNRELPDPVRGPAYGAFWFTVWVPADDVETGLAEARALIKRHEDAARWQAPIVYPMRFLRRNAPLLYPANGPFAGLFLFGVLRGGRPPVAILEIERDVGALVGRRVGWRRYVQSDVLHPRFDHRRYFGERVYRAFLDWKNQLDPLHLFNRGSVFPSP